MTALEHTSGRLTRADRSQSDVRRCTSDSERSACRDLALRELRTGPYGVADYARVRSSLGVESWEFLGAFDRSSAALVGCCRLQLDYPVLQHDNLAAELARYCSFGRRFVDVGAYIDRSSRNRGRIFEDLFVSLIQDVLGTGLDAIYIQVHPDRAGRYAALGFQIGTSKFRVDGWATEWVGMFLDVQSVLLQHARATFQDRWKQGTGRALNSRLWGRVASILNPSERR